MTRHVRRGSFKMGIIKSTHITLLGAFLLAVGTASAWAQPAQYTGDQNQSDSNTARKDKKSEKADAGASAAHSAPDSGTAPFKEEDHAEASGCYGQGCHRGFRERTCLKDPNYSAGASDKRRWHGMGEHGFRRLSQARNSLVWKDETGQVHDRSGRPKGRLPRS